jgi:hypothetical protein
VILYGCDCRNKDLKIGGMTALTGLEHGKRFYSEAGQWLRDGAEMPAANPNRSYIIHPWSGYDKKRQAYDADVKRRDVSLSILRGMIHLLVDTLLAMWHLALFAFIQIGSAVVDPGIEWKFVEEQIEPVRTLTRTETKTVPSSWMYASAAYLSRRLKLVSSRVNIRRLRLGQNRNFAWNSCPSAKANVRLTDAVSSSLPGFNSSAWASSMLEKSFQG